MHTPTISGSLPPASSRPHQRRRRALCVLLILLLIAVAGLGYGAWRVFGTLRSEPGAYYDQQSNAVWIAHAWAGQPQSATDYERLAQLLVREQVRYVYAHVGPLKSDGTIPPSLYPNAAQFVRTMKQRDSRLQIYAWIGQVATDGGGILDLDDAQVRANIAATARHFTHELGFDGVHYDIEPIHDGDTNFLSLLEATRRAIGDRKAISISAPKWIPAGVLMPVIQPLLHPDQAWWTSGYYTQVSAYVNQIAVMLYGTGATTPAIYELIVKEETAAILSAVARAPHPAQVLIGIPTFHDNGRGFSDVAENMTTGLKGVVAGLDATPAGATHVFAGVAIYPLWLTTPADWSQYDHLWLGR
jgi:hypothetical protein